MPVLDQEDHELINGAETMPRDVAENNDPVAEVYSRPTSKKSILTEHWAKSYWRPGMAWLYMLICACDFVIFPVVWAIIQASSNQPITQWNPITLHGAGLIHLAFGAILGVAAYGRSREKLYR